MAAPSLFWLFAVALVLYGICETMFGNWGTTLLVGGGVSVPHANTALAAFWAGVTVGRLVIALVSERVRSTRIYVVLPWAVAGALVVAPAAHSATTGVLLFAAAGLACSGFFPMTIGYGQSTFPNLLELAAGWLIAAYQLGWRPGRLRRRCAPGHRLSGRPLPPGRHRRRGHGRPGHPHRPPATPGAPRNRTVDRGCVLSLNGPGAATQTEEPT